MADVRVRSTPGVIQREASQRRIDVSANVSGRSVGDVRSDVRDRIRDLQFPLEYHAEVIGAASGDEATVSRLVGFGIVAAIGIFLLLQAAFRSWRLAGLAFVTLPIALVGGLLASLIDGTTFSLGALIGLLAVFAIAVRNVIVLIEPLPAPRAARGQEPRRPSSSSGDPGERLSPILTTAFATGLAAAAVRVPRQPCRPRDRAPDGRRGPGRSGHVDPAEPVRRARPLPELRRRAARRRMTPEDELLHRWAGVTPEAAAAPAGANGDPLPAGTGACSTPGESQRAPPGSPTHSGADSGIQPRGDE